MKGLSLVDEHKLGQTDIGLERMAEGDDPTGATLPCPSRQHAAVSAVNEKIVNASRL